MAALRDPKSFACARRSTTRVLDLLWIGCAVGCALPSAAHRSSPGPDRLAAQIDARFHDLDRSDGPGCSVAVSRRGTTVLVSGYGMANLDHGIHNGADTAFYVASVAKQVTALAIALLVHDGALGIDDDVPRSSDHYTELD